MEFRVLQQNVHGSNNKNDIVNIAIVQNNYPDVVFFSEVPNGILDNIGGYHIEHPMGGTCAKDKATCVLAIKQDSKVDFKEQVYNEISDMISLDRRYITVSLCFNRSLEIECFFAYVPQCYPIVPSVIYGKTVFNGIEKIKLPDADINKGFDNFKKGMIELKDFKNKYVAKIVTYNQDRVEQKAEMLFGAYLFWLENKDKNVFIGGDLNTDLDGKEARCKSIFKKLYNEMEDTVEDKFKGQPTWNKECLDYALVSESLKGKCSTKYIREEDAGSDHKGLLTTITI